MASMAVLETLIVPNRIAGLDEGGLLKVDTPQRVWYDPATPFVSELVEKPAQQLAAFQGGD